MTENENQEIDPGDLTLEMFEPHLNSEFHLDQDSEVPVVLRLLEALSASDHRPSEEQQGRSPFTLVFACDEVPLPQGTYCLSHDVIGTVSIFMTPFAVHEQGHKLEAVFS
jgi:hypothetical protein